MPELKRVTVGHGSIRRITIISVPKKQTNKAILSVVNEKMAVPVDMMNAISVIGFQMNS